MPPISPVAYVPDVRRRRRRMLSGRSAILVDQGAESIDALDRSGGVARRLEGDRRVEVNATMRPGLVVVADELDEDPLKVNLAEDEHPVQALSTGRPDEPLGIRV
jgi:hypothetical protein